MTGDTNISARLFSAGIVPVVKLSNQAQAIPLADTLAQGGCRLRKLLYAPPVQ